MQKIDIAGLKVDNTTKKELLGALSGRLKKDQKTFAITPYSEFLYHGLLDPQLMELFNKADFSVPDGIGLFWAAKYLQVPLTAQSYYGKILQAFWQMMYTGAAIVLNPNYIRSAFAEKIPGSDFIWDVTMLAAQNKWSIYLLGGFGDTPKLAADQLQLKTNHTLKILGQGFSTYQNLFIAGCSSKHPTDPTIIDDIKKSQADIVFVAYGPVKQEKWIIEHRDKLPAKLFIGLGGTFDYIAGKQTPPPRFIRSIGLEWLWRLFTQPHRVKRIWQATIGLMTALLRYKIIGTLPLRKNVVSIILNKKNEILICKRNPAHKFSSNGAAPHYSHEDHWQFPQGGREAAESIETTAVREAGEESGLQGLSVLKTSARTYAYEWKNRQRKVLSEPQYRGQEQNIVYLRFSGSDTDVQVDRTEFTDYRWVPIGKLEKLVHPQRRPVARIVQEDLKDLA